MPHPPNLNPLLYLGFLANLTKSDLKLISITLYKSQLEGISLVAGFVIAVFFHQSLASIMGSMQTAFEESWYT